MMEYLTGPGHEIRSPIDGGIIQAPASDRENINLLMDKEVFHKSCESAQKMINDGFGNNILPAQEINGFFECPVSARRWISIASPNHDGDDDYFSSDLTDQQLIKTFGALPATSPLCILFSGSDEYVPKSVNKEEVLKRWIGFVKKGKGTVDEENSGIMEGASHNLAGNDKVVVQGLVKRVLGYLNRLSVQPNL